MRRNPRYKVQGTKNKVQSTYHEGHSMAARSLFLAPLAPPSLSVSRSVLSLLSLLLRQLTIEHTIVSPVYHLPDIYKEENYGVLSILSPLSSLVRI